MAPFFPCLVGDFRVCYWCYIERVIAYTGRSSTLAEKKYGVGEQELLAVVHALTV
jgi:hypothetical protein